MFRFVLALSFAWPMGAKAQWTVFNLHPAGATRSLALEVSGGKQVGVAVVGGTQCASLWSGNASSWVNKHVYVVGWGHDPTAQRDEALMWRRRR